MDGNIISKMLLIVILFSREGKINKEVYFFRGGGRGEVLKIGMLFIILTYAPRLKQFEIHMINLILEFITQD